jgi:hypothetical protein
VVRIGMPVGVFFVTGIRHAARFRQSMKPFRVQVADGVLADLRRFSATRFPPPS